MFSINIYMYGDVFYHYFNIFQTDIIFLYCQLALLEHNWHNLRTIINGHRSLRQSNIAI